jgi:PAS domain S-box-containing protein
MSHEPSLQHDAVSAALPVIRPAATLMGAALARLSEGVILADETGRITFLNDAAARLHGDALLGIMPGQYAETFHLLREDGTPYPSAELPLARAVLRGETVVDTRWRIRRPDGSEVVAIGSARPVLGPSGEQLGALLTVRDDTAREDAARARAAADAATRRMTFLSEASERLAASLDYETTLRQVVGLAVPTFADWAVYTVDAGDGTLRFMASHHVVPGKEAFIGEIARRYPIRADEPAGAAKVIRTGESELIPQIPDALLEAIARDSEHLELLRAIGFRSLLTVPVIAQGRVLGALGFVTGESGRSYGADDLAFAQELARRAATAIDHARLFAEAEAARREADAERVRSTGILETMADAHFVLDAELRFVSVNAATERNLAQSRERLLGRRIWDAFPATVGSVFESAYRRVVGERIDVHFSGAYLDDALDIVPEVDAYPTVDGGVAVFWRDIGPRVRAEAALRASEQRLRDVFEQAPVAVAVMSGAEHIYTAVSPMYAKTPGLGRPLLGRSMREAFPEVVGKGYIEAMDEVYHTGVPFQATERSVVLARPEDGVLEERFFNIGYQPLRDGAGAVYAVASVAYDVTDQVRARREVDAARVEAERERAEAEAARREAERQRVAAEQANRAKSDFLSTMSHELRTPLNAIAGYTQLLALGLRGPVTDEQRQDLERIRLASQHLMGLVTDVLNFARLDAGQIEYQLETVELATVMADLEPLVGPQLAAKGLSFDHDGCAPDTPDQPQRVRTDPEKLRQILLNLLTNAIKFTDAGGRVSIACDTHAAAGVARIRVSDTGRGIPSDQLERIFEPFVQVDRHRTTGSQQGVGLGLAISRDLARGMGGELTAASTLGQGSTFTLTLRAE